ncbi:MAG: glycosyltransferase [Acidobacteria bacterium]|nr:glycosyltransferase [Acidobacteriota bacterium]MCB9396303.1 glycosyltransferase [Acidobacteriota bacterium]
MAIRVLRVQSRICVGGPALHTILLTAHLKEPFETKLVGGRLEPGESPMDAFAAQHGVSIELIEEMGRSLHWWDDLKALMRMIGLIRRYRPHIVHTHTAKAGLIGRLAAWLCRVPIRIHTFHGHVFEGYFSPFFNQVMKIVERFLAWTSTRILAISPRQHHDLVNRFHIVPASKCQIVPLGFELESIRSAPQGRFKARLNLSPNMRLAGILARLVPIKNHELLLQGIAAWAKLNRKWRPDQLQFLIIGDGECRADLEKSATDLGITVWVRFTGWQGQVGEIYADLDLNLLTSKNEGTPVTLIEGLAAGVPFLATDAGGIRDIYEGPFGEVVPINCSPSELGAALQRWLDKDQLRVPQALQAEIAERFSRQRLVEDINKLYLGCLKEKGL